MGVLKTMQPCHLIGTLNHAEEGVELGFDLLIGVVQRLKEDRVARQQETAQAGLFINHQLDQAVAVEDDNVGAIHGTRTLLDALQAVAEDESKNSKRCDGQGEETEQKPAIEPRFHSIFPRVVW
jgi:hypothetical protein